MTELLSRKQVADLIDVNPIAALARCQEVLERQGLKDSKRQAWERLMRSIPMPPVKAVKPVKVVKPVKAIPTKPAKAVKAVRTMRQIDGSDGSRIVSFTAKSVPGYFCGQVVELSDETWRYLTRPLGRGPINSVGGLCQPEKDLAEYYRVNGINPSKASVSGCGDYTLIAMAMDNEGGK